MLTPTFAVATIRHTECERFQNPITSELFVFIERRAGMILGNWLSALAGARSGNWNMGGGG